MSTVAALGLAVDSTPVTRATASLKDFAPAALGAAKGADAFNASTTQSETRTRAIQAAADRAGVSFKEMEARIKATSSAVASASSGMGQYEAQARKVEQANLQAMKAANDNATAVGGLSKAANENNSAFERLANTITRRFIAALVIKEIKDFTFYIWNLNSAIAATAGSAELAAISYQKFQGLTTAAGYKGVSSDTFNAAMIEFNKQTDLAKSGLGSLRTLLVQNGQTVGDTAANFGKVADMVASTSDGARKLSILQQAGLPATREFAALMSQGAAGVNKAADASTKLTDQQIQDAKRIDDAWKKMWTDFENWGKRAIVNTMGAFSTSNIPQSIPQSGNPTRITIFAKPGAANDNKPVVDPELLKQQIALEQQRIGVLGQMASVSDQVRIVELAIQAARLNNVNISKAEEANLKRLAQEQALGTFQIKAATDAENVRIAAMFKSNEAAIAYVIVQNKINEAKARGAPLTEKEIADLQKEADGFARVKVEADRTADLISTAKSAGASFSNDLISGLGKGETAVESLHNAFKNLASTLTSSALKSLFEGDLPGAAIKGIAAIGAAIFSANTSSSGEKWLKQQKEDMAARGADIASRRALIGVDTNTRAGAIIAQDQQFHRERLAENRAGGQQMNSLLLAQVEERNALMKDWDRRETDLVKANAEAKLAIEKAAADRSLGFQNRLFAATNDFSTLEGQLAAFDRTALQDRAKEVEAGGQAIVDLEAAQAAERLQITKSFKDKELEAVKAAEQAKLDAVNGAGRTITDFLRGLTSGAASTFSPQETLTNARLAYNANMPLALSGNLDAQNKFVSLADDLLKASRAVNASSQAYQDDLNQVLSQGLAMPAVQNATDPVVIEMRNVLAAINAGNATQALDATLKGTIATALTTGNIQAFVGAMGNNATFTSIDTNTDNAIDYDELIRAMGPQGVDLARDGSVAGLLTDTQLRARGIPVNGPITDAQLRAAGINVTGPITSDQLKDAKLLTDTQLRAAGVPVSGPLTDTQLRAVGISVTGPLTEAQISSLGLSKEQGNILNVFRELDNNGNGIIEKSEAIQAAANSANVWAKGTVDNTRAANDNTGNIATNMSGTKIATLEGNDTLDAIRNLQSTATSQLTLLTTALSPTRIAVNVVEHSGGNISAPVAGGSNLPAGYLNNQVVDALNKIVYNTFVISSNTAYAIDSTKSGTYVHGHAGVGTYATGGWITGGTPGIDSVPILAMQDEFMVNRNATRALTQQFGAGIMETINAGRLPFNDNGRPLNVVAPVFRGGGGDNGTSAALLAEVRELRKELANLQTVVAGSDAMTRRVIEENGDKVAGKVDDQTNVLAAQERQSNRQRKVA